ncbi:hypothetical protein ACTXT7_009473 [Hymenolepis weldensis]
MPSRQARTVTSKKRNLNSVKRQFNPPDVTNTGNTRNKQKRSIKTNSDSTVNKRTIDRIISYLMVKVGARKPTCGVNSSNSSEGANLSPITKNELNYLASHLRWLADMEMSLVYRGYGQIHFEETYSAAELQRFKLSQMHQVIGTLCSSETAVLT